MSMPRKSIQIEYISNKNKVHEIHKTKKMCHLRCLRFCNFPCKIVKLEKSVETRKTHPAIRNVWQAFRVVPLIDNGETDGSKR